MHIIPIILHNILYPTNTVPYTKTCSNSSKFRLKFRKKKQKTLSISPKFNHFSSTFKLNVLIIIINRDIGPNLSSRISGARSDGGGNLGRRRRVPRQDSFLEQTKIVARQTPNLRGNKFQKKNIRGNGENFNLGQEDSDSWKERKKQN